MSDKADVQQGTLALMVLKTLEAMIGVVRRLLARLWDCPSH